MKKKSKIDKQVSFDLWNTPIIGAARLDLESVFQTVGDIYFFFHARDKKSLSTFFYLKVDRLTPYKVTEECIAYGNIWKYIKGKTSGTWNKRQYVRTYQLWNTPYVKELDSNLVLSGYANKRDKNISQYMIRTDDETIELVAKKTEWVQYEGFMIESIISSLIKDLNYTTGTSSEETVKVTYRS